MDLEKLDKMAMLILGELPDSSYEIRLYSSVAIKFRNLMVVVSRSLPEHKELFKAAYEQISYPYSGLKVKEASSIVSARAKTRVCFNSWYVALKSGFSQQSL